MKDFEIQSIRPFIGAKDFKISRKFYLDWGFIEFKISSKLSYFNLNGFGFYLQDYYSKEWVDNSMIFLEVENLEEYHKHLKHLNFISGYTTARSSAIQRKDWGREFFVHDPSGILWHVGNFLT
ncbi:VOC family protein [Gangjinia marincola]|uniref:VOC family protein n=1 Tax=Gangjinia marincola TaxID=578463 RepID=A0ABP3XSH6_9FLAO